MNANVVQKLDSFENGVVQRQSVTYNDLDILTYKQLGHRLWQH